MPEINNLLDEKYVLNFLRKKVLRFFPSFKDIQSVKIKAYKKFIWKTSYHVVLGFTVYFLDSKKNITKIPIFCSAHSHEARKNFYQALKYLWDSGFANDNLTIPRPLFYSNQFRAVFYRGVSGENLYYYIRSNHREKINQIIPQVAKWFAKLHTLSIRPECNFNRQNSRIVSVIPGRDHILETISKKYPKHFKIYEKAYNKFVQTEEDFLNSNKKRWLIHGDAHAENIVQISNKKLAVIDYGDICLSDFARDLGCFLQQTDYMCSRKIADQNYTDKIKKIFLDTYFAKREIPEEKILKIKKRIDNYYYWTAMRTASFFLLKHQSEPERAKLLIQEVEKNYL